MRRDLTPKAAGLMVADVAVIGVLVAGAGVLLGPAYGGSQYLLALTVGALAGGLAALVPALLRWPGWTTVPAAVVLYLLFGAVAVPSTAVGGVLPSLESVRLLGLGVVTSWKQMLTVAVPVGSSGALLVPAYLSALVCSALGGLIALRTRRAGAALLAPAAMAAVAAVLGAATAGFVVLVGTVGAVGGLLWAGWRRRRAGLAGLDARRPLALLVVVIPAVAAGLLLGPHLLADQPRTIARDVVQPPFDPQTLPSPLSGFRSYVKKNRDTVLFSVAGLPAGGRVRLAVMDDYTGQIYTTSPDTGVFNRVGDRIASVPAGAPAELTVQIKGYSDVWLPDAGYLSGITFTGDRSSALTEQFRYDTGSGAGVVTGGLTDGDGYTAAVSLPATPDPATMAGVPVETTSQPAPLKVPQEVKDKAAEWAGDATSPYQIAFALQQGLRDAGYVSHGDDGALNSPAGHGADRIRRLLTAPIMVGDQEQYAVTMALMARSLGLPARVVMGFRPTGPVTDGGTVDVTGRMVTAWVEIPFAGVGWVAFDPTPDEAKVPQQKDDKQAAANPQNRLQPPPPPPDTKQGDTRSVQDADQQDQQENDKNDDDLPPPGASVHWVRWVLIGLSPLLLLLPVLIILLLKVLRRRRRQAGPPAERIAGGWAHVLDAATDLGAPPAAGATRRETAGAIDARFGGSTAVLAREADTRVWAPDDVQPADADRFWAEVDAAVTGMSRTRGPWGRLRAMLSIRSLRRNDPR